MLAPSKPKPSSKLVLTSILSCSLTIVFSLTFTILCILALAFRFDCTAAPADDVGGASFFVATVFRTYIQDSECENAHTMEGLTSDYAVFVLTAISLSASLVCLILAIAFLTVLLLPESAPQPIKLLAYGYVGACAASLAVDLTFATHFGIDYAFLTDSLSVSSGGLGFHYMLDMVRIGAFLLMTLSLKGFLGHVINIVLLVLVIVYLVEYSQSVEEYEHSIHKMGVLKAFDSRRNTEQPKCVSCQASVANGNGGSQLNFGYMSDDEVVPPRPLTRENSRRDRDDFSNPSFDRSYSWQQGPPAQRPFSYLEEAKRAPPRAPASPSVGEPQWRRGGWPQPPPPVPAPDYSPHASRRLKSALKPAYM